MLKIILRNKTTYSLLLSVACLLVLFIPMMALGQADGGAGKKTEDDSLIQNLLWGLVNGVFGFLVWLSGKLLDTAVTTFVIGFGELYNTSGLGFAVDNLWRVVRDIFNLTFIFGLVYIGFKMILNSGDTNAKRLLINIIMAALLVNFSLFFTKFIIEFSNVAATQVAGAFDAGGGDYQVSGKFMNAMGLSSIFADDGSMTNAFGTNTGNGYTYIFGTLFLFIVTAFAFFAGGILLMIRFAVLNLYMILSPIMFLGWVFPSLASYSATYWRSFLSRAFYAPAYLLMLYFCFVVFNEFAAVTRSGSLSKVLTDANSAQADFASTIPYFAIMIIFLLASIVIGQKMGAEGGAYMVSMGKGAASRGGRILKRTAGAATFGLTAKAGRQVVGGTANKIAESKGLREWAAKSKAGETLLKGTRRVADSSFDARKIGGMGTYLGIGEGAKSGYATQIKEQNKADEEFSNSLTRKTRGYDGKLTEDAAKAVDKALTEDKELQGLRDLQGTADKNIENLTTKKTDTEKEKAEKETAIAEAKEAGNTEAQENLEKELSHLDKTLTNLDKDIANANQIKDTTAKNIENQEKKISTKAEADYKYADRIAFREHRREIAESWRNRGTLGAGIAGGAAGVGAAGLIASTAGLAALPLALTILSGAAVGGAAGVGAARGYAERNDRSAMNLMQRYGRQGEDIAKVDKANNDLKVIHDRLKAIGGEGDKKQTSSDSDKQTPPPPPPNPGTGTASTPNP